MPDCINVYQGTNNHQWLGVPLVRDEADHAAKLLQSITDNDVKVVGRWLVRPKAHVQS
jgi:hypothetical protein